jgi:thiamine-phosphate pyrophosphorylase
VSDTSSPCRLYLVVPADAGPETVEAFEQALDAGDVGAALLRCTGDGTVERSVAGKLLAIAASHDVAFLTESDVEAAEAIGADGVHVAGDETPYEAARTALGDEAIVGVQCPPERHIALTLAEAGADYVAFSQTPGRGDGKGAELDEILTWWAEIVEVPAVAWLADTLEEARALARTGADFVAVSESVWRAGQGPAEAVRALNLALAETRSAA